MPKSNFEQAYKLAAFIVRQYFPAPDEITLTRFNEIVRDIETQLEY